MIQSMTELKELEIEKKKFRFVRFGSAWRDARPIFWPFATHVWVATHTLGTTDLYCTTMSALHPLNYCSAFALTDWLKNKLKLFLTSKLCLTRR